MVFAYNLTFFSCFAPLPRCCLTEITKTGSNCYCETACKNLPKLEQWVCCVRSCIGNMSVLLITLQSCIHHVVNYQAEITPLIASFSNDLPTENVGTFILHLWHLFGRTALRPDALCGSKRLGVILIFLITHTSFSAWHGGCLLVANVKYDRRSLQGEPVRASSSLDRWKAA